MQKIRRVSCVGAILCFIIICALPPQVAALSKEGFGSLHTFSRVLHDISTYYVEPVDESRLLEGAMQGMLESLDPHSAYLPPQYYKALRQETGGRFTGVGLEVMPKRGWLTVVSPIDGSPAAHAGIKPGDQIIKINGESTKQMDSSAAVAKMRGKPGTSVRITILRPGTRMPFDVSLRRANVQVQSVRSELLAPGFPYIRLTGFQEHTYDDLLAAMKTFTAQGKIQGLVLDLRNNPGGLLEQAVAICDLFLRDGVILTTVSRGKEIDRRVAHADGTEPNYPIVILVNGGSASASEIVTGALQDHKRALVVGTQTFGKGSVQTLIELDDGSALKLTVARYYTPSKRAIQAFGIPPDVIAGDTAPGEKAAADAAATNGEKEDRPTEATLPGHLKAEAHRSNIARLKIPLPKVRMTPGDVDYQRAVGLALLQNGTAARYTAHSR